MFVPQRGSSGGSCLSVLAWQSGAWGYGPDPGCSCGASRRNQHGHPALGLLPPQKPRAAAFSGLSCTLGRGGRGSPSPCSKNFPFFPAQLGEQGRKTQGQKQISPKVFHTSPHFYGELKQKKGGGVRREKAVVSSPQQEPQCEQHRATVRAGGRASLPPALSACGSQRPDALVLDTFSLLSSLQPASSSVNSYSIWA